MSSNSTNEIYNIGSDINLKFYDIFKYIISRSKSKSKFILLPRINLSFVFKILFILRLSPISSYHLTMLNNNFRFDCTKLKKLGWKSTKNIYEVFMTLINFILIIIYL